MPITLEKPCKEDAGYLVGKGYPAKKRGNKHVLLHREACQEYYGYSDEEMDGKLVCHKCNNKACYEPTHLYLGSDSDNQKDSLVAGTHNFGKLSVDDVLEIRSDPRSQKTIAKEYRINQTTVSRIKTGSRWGWL